MEEEKTNNLNDKLEYIIENNGPLSVAEFIQYALFDHQYGYYNKQQPFGTTGDFITSPEISQIFGEIIGSYAAYKWIEKGKPERFQIIELGPGNGSLMNDLLRATKNISGFHDAITICLVEASNRLKNIQKNRLKQYKPQIIHHESFDSIPINSSFIIANEFFDALPVDQYIFNNNKWYERKIGINNKTLSFIINEENPVISAGNIINEPFPPKNDDIYELSLNAINIMDNIANFICNTNSSALIIDYGYIKKSYGNTLQALKQHKYCNIFHNIGTADLTTHVDFDALIKTISKYKKLQFDITTQRQFLLSLGIAERTTQLLKNLNSKEQEKIQNSTNRLVDKHQMGELFKTLIIN